MCQRTYWKRASRDLSFDDFVSILDEFPQLTDLKLQGMGEPFLNKDFFRMVEYAKTKGITVSTYTNATLFSDAGLLEKLVNCNLDLLRISMDGGSREQYESIRKGASFDQVARNISAIATGRKTIMTIELWTLLMGSNVFEIPKLIDFACENGISTINCQLILNTFSYKKEVGRTVEDMQIDTSSHIISAIKEGIRYAESRSVSLKLAFSKVYSSVHKCHWSFDKAFVSVEGYVVPCCTIADPSVINMGNIFNEPFETIWYGEKYLRFRKSILEDELSPPCQHCYSSRHKDVLSSLNVEDI
jgi:pyrroloquinoline quinone biosynthesis protein E